MKKVLLLIVLGQSNAHGHGTLLSEKQKILQPLKNVYGLSRKYNQVEKPNRVIWSGYTSYGMNLGETQDHTWCLATELARMWQTEIDAGRTLPDLYIIQSSIGSQGVHCYEKKGRNMWYYNRPLVVHPGVLGEVNISLYPFTRRILKLAMRSLMERVDCMPEIAGLHWNQWETEVDTGDVAIDHAYENYWRLWEGFGDALGTNYPLYLYRPLSDVYEKPEEVKKMNGIFEQFCQERENTKILDISKSDLWKGFEKNHGIFQEDGIHYSPEAHQWFARQQFEDLMLKWRID